MNITFTILQRFLFFFQAETAHNITLAAMKARLAPRRIQRIDPALETTIWGLHFPNPVGLAAGFDKNADVILPALSMGFGFVEAGTVTPKPQEGNKKPRIFRSKANGAVINRMGFPNKGVEVFKKNLLTQMGHDHIGTIGINIGMNKDQKEPEEDYRLLIRELGEHADYLTINISSPNTPGLRNLQERGNLLKLAEAVLDEREKSCKDNKPPLLIKLAPDLTPEQQKEIAGTIMETEIDGLILTNTTLDRPETLGDTDFRKQAGGLSGQPLTDKSTETISNFYKLTEGKIPIIGVGGIASGDQAYEKIRAGASLIQLYTGMVYEGPDLIPQIHHQILYRLHQDGFDHLSEAVGANHKINREISKIG